MRLRLLCLAFLLTGSMARGEFPALERVLQPGLKTALPSLKGATVVVAVRDGARKPRAWRLPQAIQTELVASLRGQGIEAIEAESEPELAWLSRQDRAWTAADVERWRKS